MSEQSEQLRIAALQARRENRLEDAKRDLIWAVAQCRAAHEDIALARSLTALGQIERDLLNNELALLCYEEAVAIYRKGNDALILAHTIRHVADIQRHQGLTAAADTNYREALELYRAHKQSRPLELANAIQGYAILKQEAGEVEQAKSLWEEARELYAAVGIREGVEESSRRLRLIA
jgi:tetratricopeptide (TPR) repeat protein